MSDEIEERLKAIRADVRQSPVPAISDVQWLVTAVREQMARAERAEAKLATTSHFLVEADSDNRIIRGERDEFLARAEKAGNARSEQCELYEKREAELLARAEVAERRAAAGDQRYYDVAKILPVQFRDDSEQTCNVGNLAAAWEAEQAINKIAVARAGAAEKERDEARRGQIWALDVKDEVCRERDDAEKACAAMRAALSDLVERIQSTPTMSGHLTGIRLRPDGETAHLTSDAVRAARAALATDAGRDWVPRAEFEQAQKLDEIRAELLETVERQGREAERQRCAEIVREECQSDPLSVSDGKEALDRILKGAQLLDVRREERERAVSFIREAFEGCAETDRSQRACLQILEGK